MLRAHRRADWWVFPGLATVSPPAFLIPATVCVEYSDQRGQVMWQLGAYIYPCQPSLHHTKGVVGSGVDERGGGVVLITEDGRTWRGG
jgi:hypothetical protein